MKTLSLKRPHLLNHIRGDWAYIAAQHNDARADRGMMVTFAASHDVRSQPVIVWALGEMTAVLR